MSLFKRAQLQTFEGRATLYDMIGGSIRDYPAAMALALMLDDRPEDAEKWLRIIPRNQRGKLNVALEDLSMQLSRLGN